jgi:hypothetical protein
MNEPLAEIYIIKMPHNSSEEVRLNETAYIDY